MNSLLERLRFSRIIFRPVAKNVVCKAVAHEKQRKQSAWKSYARKSASIAAKHLQCSEKFLENDEKYSEKRHLSVVFYPQDTTNALDTLYRLYEQVRGKGTFPPYAVRPHPAPQAV